MAKKRPPHAGEKARIEARRARVSELMRQGVTRYRDIGAKLRVCPATVCHDVQALLKELHDHSLLDIQAARDVELARLDDLQASIAKDARKGQLGAIDRILHIMDRRAKLLGLDAPTKVAHDGLPTSFTLLLGDKELGHDG